MASLAIVGTTVLSYAAASIIGVPMVVPILNTAAAFPFMFAALRAGRVPRAIGLMLIWAGTMAVCSTIMSFVRPVATEALFVHAAEYKREMFAWVASGIGAESDPRQFVPQHGLHAVVFCALSLTTGSVVSMPMGALLMNYMGHYVGALAAQSGAPAITAVLAWVPWALIRIVSYVTLGVLLGAPLLARVGGFEFRCRTYTKVVTLAVAGLFLDVVLKWILAPWWAGLLRHTMGRS